MRRCLLVVTVAVAAFACGDNNKLPSTAVGPVEVTCGVLPPSANTCDVTAGSATMLLRGTVLTPTTVYKGGEVAVDPAGQISCVGCNCGTGGETTISCPDAAISPGLINTHDHITYTHNDPYVGTTERYEDRQQWRIGKDGHYAIPYNSSATADQVRWGELRFLMGGATSIVGSGGQAGLLRNLDQAANEEGLGHKAVNFDTFPLDDANGTQRTSDCNYGGNATTVASLASVNAYEPHTSEGIDATARNEFLCESSTTYDAVAPGVSNNLLIGKTAMIHAIGLTADDYDAMAKARTGLIWSPRSNLSLYGDTARVTTAAELGVEIALGTDWMPSGSMNLLRELACADSFNATYLGHYFRDDQLWDMVTINAASVTKTDDAIGLLKKGMLADISIFASHGKPPFRSVLEAQPSDVALVMRGGKVLYGDDAVVGALAQTCDAVDVCGTAKRVCLMGEVSKTYSALQAAANLKGGAPIYPAFACDVPMNEPTCVPSRPASVDGSTMYDGMVSKLDSDGDGIPDATDNCPHVFNPVRPLDNGVQGDADGDGVGDACDPCPLDAHLTTCVVPNPSDRDGDGVPNSSDNCPDTPNPDQTDTDHDGKGNACDACPMDANPGSEGCPTTIYQVKDGTNPVGTAVRLLNVLVTGRGSNGFFVQVKTGDDGDKGPDNSGLFVFTNTAPPAAASIGGRVDVAGSVANFQGEIELDTVTSVKATSAGPELPVPVAVSYADIKTGGPRAATLEGVVVSVGAASVTAVDMGFGEITLKDAGANVLIVDDFAFAPAPLVLPPVGQAYTGVTGILAMRQMASKLEPRNAQDFALGPPSIKSFGPSPSFARVGVTNDLPTLPPGHELTVTLSGPAQGATSIAFTSSDPALMVDSPLVIPDGATTGVVKVTAVSPLPDVTVTATLAAPASTATAHVRVLDAGEDAVSVTLSPKTATIAAGAPVQFTATLDAPALMTAKTVNLSVNPPLAGMLPVSVDIPVGSTSATFTYTDTMAPPTATITASFMASTDTAIVTVTVVVGQNHLIINEVDYDQIATDAAEFVEIYNPTDAPLPLAGKALVLVNGNTNPPSVYPTNTSIIDLGLAPVASLPSHQYLVIAGSGVTVPMSAIKLQTTWTTNAIQNGGDATTPSADGVALIDTATHTVIDALSYEGAITNADLTHLGFTSPVSLLEGTMPPTAADSNTVAGSLCRLPDGTDTDNAMSDWKFCTASTPGTANSP